MLEEGWRGCWAPQGAARGSVGWPAAGLAVRGVPNSPCESVRDLDHCVENLNFSEFDEAKTTSMASSFGGETEVKTVFSGVGCFGALWCL